MKDKKISMDRLSNSIISLARALDNPEMVLRMGNRLKSKGGNNETR